jgi:hypothetical protein
MTLAVTDELAYSYALRHTLTDVAKQFCAASITTLACVFPRLRSQVFCSIYDAVVGRYPSGHGKAMVMGRASIGSSHATCWSLVFEDEVDICLNPGGL